MPSINELSTSESVTSADAVPVWNSQHGDTRRLPVGVLLAYFKTALGLVTAVAKATVLERAAPFDGGPEIAVKSSSTNVRLILQPTNNISAATVLFPDANAAADGIELTITSTRSIGSLLIRGNGATVNNAPGLLNTGGYVTFVYDKAALAWFRIG